MTTTYTCTKCGRSNCKLWREIYSCSPLYCVRCIDNPQVNTIGEDGTFKTGYGEERSDQIGYFVPAVPSEDLQDYYCYGSVPEDRIKWWQDLPNVGIRGKQKLV